MKRAAILTILAMLAVAAACDDPSFPPQACVVLPDTEVFIGEQETVALCFQDPDGDAITVEATASDPSVVEAEVQSGGQGILLTGRDAGQAVITVVARDSNGLSAQQTFDVTVPNRPPEATALPDITLRHDAPEASLTLTEYFTDPDGHTLTFSAAVSDEAAIRASVMNDVLHVEPVGHGTAVVLVTATDPHGLSASADAKVRLRVGVELLTDEFETLSDRWEIEEGVAEIVDGRLRLSSNDLESVGIVSHAVDLSTDWTVTMNTEYVTDDMWPGLGILTDDEHVQAILVLFGGDYKRITDEAGAPETNLVISMYLRTDGWIVLDDWLGRFDEIEGKGRAMNVGVRLGVESLKVLVDDAVIHEVPREFGTSRIPAEIREVGLLAWPPSDVESFDGSEQTYFDWIRITGIPTGASPTEVSLAAQRRFPPAPSSVRIIR